MDHPQGRAELMAGWRVHAELKGGTGVWTFCIDPWCKRRHYIYKPFTGVVDK